MSSAAIEGASVFISLEVEVIWFDLSVTSASVSSGPSCSCKYAVNIAWMFSTAALRSAGELRDIDEFERFGECEIAEEVFEVWFEVELEQSEGTRRSGVDGVVPPVAENIQFEFIIKA